MFGSKRENMFHNDKGNLRWNKHTLTVARISQMKVSNRQGPFNP